MTTNDDGCGIAPGMGRDLIKQFLAVGQAVLDVANRMVVVGGHSGTADGFDFFDVDEEEVVVTISDPCRCGQGCWDERLVVPMPYVLRHLAGDAAWESDYRAGLEAERQAAKQQRIQLEEEHAAKVEAAERREFERLAKKYSEAS